MTREGRQPMARKMPISRVRSKTDMNIVFKHADAADDERDDGDRQAKPLNNFIWPFFFTNRLAALRGACP